VREHLTGLGRKSFGPAQVARALGETNAARVKDALRAFWRRGEIIALGDGKYRYRGSEMVGRRPARVEPRIYRAIYASRLFTSREISILSDAKMKLVKKLIWELRCAGEVEMAAKRNARHGGRQYVYRVRDRDGFFLRHIRKKGHEKG
jgi:hypothetical protein